MTLLAGHLRLRLFRSAIPILHARDVRHAEVVAVPPVEPVHLEHPESAPHVREDDEAIVVADVDAKGTLHHARRARPAVVRGPAETVLVFTLTREKVALGYRMLRVLEVEH